MSRKKVLRPSQQAEEILASLTSVSWLSKPGPWSGEGIPICLFALEPNITQDLKSNDTPHLERATNNTPDMERLGSACVPFEILREIWLCT